MSKLIYLCLLLFNVSFIHSQVLRNVNVNLNTNGLVMDVEYIPQADMYIVVGEFTSINGTARKNFAALRGTDFSVLPMNPIVAATSNGRFTSVEHIYFPAETVGNMTIPGRHLLYLGGNFTQLNGNAITYLATLTFNELLTTFSQTSNLTLVNHNFQLESSIGYIPGFNYGVKDIYASSDTLIISGHFSSINVNGTLEDTYNMVSCKATKSPSPFLTIINTDISSDLSNDKILTSTKIGADYYYSNFSTFYPESRIFKSSNPAQGLTLLNNFNNGNINSAKSNYVYNIQKLNDSIALVKMNSHMLMPLKIQGPALNIGNSSFYNYQFNGVNFPTYQNFFSNSIYNNDIIVLRSYLNGSYFNKLQRYEISGFGSGPTVNQINLVLKNENNSFSPATSLINFQSIDSLIGTTIVNDKLFVSARELTAVNGQPKAGFAIFCLEPQNPVGPLNGTNLVCQGDSYTYTFQDVKYNLGYRFNYSGSGIQYSFDGGNTWINQTPNYMYATSATGTISFKIRYLDNSTSGILSIEPYNTCNTSTDYLYAKPLNLNIQVNPKPTLSLSASNNLFSCLTDSITLSISSNSNTPNYHWFYNSLLSATTHPDTIIAGSGTTAASYPYGVYIATVTNEYGCSRSDTITINADFTLPAITAASIVSNPAEWNCQTDSMQISLNLANVNAIWYNSDSSIFTNNDTLSLYNINSTAFTVQATSILNGCSSTSNFFINTNVNYTAPALPAYTLDSNQIVIDTISCANNTLQVVCAPNPFSYQPSYATAYWVINGIQIGDTLNLSAADSANAQNGIKVFQYCTQNSLNGCIDTAELIINFLLTPPVLGQVIGSTNFNCSNSEVLLQHQLTNGSVQEGWLNSQGINTLSDTMTVNSIGNYFYMVTDTVNGCSNTDTIQVSQTNELLLYSSNDTLVCQGSNVLLSTQPLGLTEPVSYSWSTGAVGNTTSIIGADTTITVIVQSTVSNCIGYDTILVSIPVPVNIDVLEVAGCGGNGSLQITNTSGGTGSYTYSLNNNTFSDTTLFENLAVGNYNITVQDGLGCTYSFIESVTGTAQGPQPEFLITTYSQIGNTLAVVNVTSYTGFDSVAWVFPPNIIIDSLFDSIAIIHALDTGWFEITLIGYLDSCSFSFTKSFKVNEFGPNYSEMNNSYGIQNFTIAPNPVSASFNNYTFNVAFEFGIEQDFELYVVNEFSQILPGMQIMGNSAEGNYSLSFPPDTPPGNYHVVLVSTFDATVESILLVP